MLTVAAPDHPLSQLKRVTQDDLISHTEITLAYMQDSLLVAESPETANYLAFTQYELIRDAVMDGAGWADLPLPLIAEAVHWNRNRRRAAPWWAGWPTNWKPTSKPRPRLEGLQAAPDDHPSARRRRISYNPARSLTSTDVLPRQ